VTVEADRGDHARVIDAQRHAQLVAAQRVLVVRFEIKRRERLPVPGRL